MGKGLGFPRHGFGLPTRPRTRRAACVVVGRARRQVDGVTRARASRASWLGRRCSHMLAHDKELKFEAVPVLRPKVHRQGPNKRQKLSQAAAVPVPELGHTWTITSSAKNLCVKCQACSLFAQKTDPAPLMDFVLSHPSKGFKATPAANCNIHPSHSIENLGSVWRCTECLCSSVRVSASLSKTCGGRGKTKSGKVSENPPQSALSKQQGFQALFGTTPMVGVLPQPAAEVVPARVSSRAGQ